MLAEDPPAWISELTEKEKQEWNKYYPGTFPEQGTKYDHGKPIVSLIDPDWLLEVAEVLTFGAEKYAKDNWKHVDNARERYLSAAYRHILAYQKGLENDPESNLSHLAHATCCLMFLHFLGRNDETKS